MKVTTNLKKLTEPDAAEVRANEILEENRIEREPSVGIQMYETYQPTYEKIKRKPKLMKKRRR